MTVQDDIRVAFEKEEARLADVILRLKARIELSKAQTNALEEGLEQAERDLYEMVKREMIKRELD